MEIYAVLVFLACGLFCGGYFVWNVRRGVEPDVKNLQERFNLGARWTAAVRLAAYIHAMIPSAGLVSLAIAGACATAMSAR